MSVTPDEVRRIAALARLELTSGEVGAMSEQLSSILGHMDALAQVDATGFDSFLPGSERAAPVRVDTIGSDPLERSAAEIAPDWREDFFVVPRLAALDAEAVEGSSA